MIKHSEIVDRMIWDSLGNSCRITLRQIDANLYEVETQRFNQDVPRTIRGSLGIMINWGQHWVDARKAGGFK